MKALEAKVPDRTIKVERFGSVSEFRAVVSRRRPVSDDVEHDAYLSDDRERRADEQWNGFGSAADLRRRLVVGRPDLRMAKAADRTAARIRCEATAAPEERRTVVGECVDMAAYWMGLPECMIAIEEAETVHPVIRIIVDSTLPSSMDAEDMLTAGTAFAAVVTALEARGFRVAIDTLATANDLYDTARSIAAVVPVKAADRPMSAAMLAFALADPAWSRGVLFSWISTCPDYWGDYNLGCGLSTVMSGERYAEAVKAVAGEGTVLCLRTWTERARGLRWDGVDVEDIPVRLAEDIIAEIFARRPRRAYGPAAGGDTAALGWAPQARRGARRTITLTICYWMVANIIYSEVYVGISRERARRRREEESS